MKHQAVVVVAVTVAFALLMYPLGRMLFTGKAVKLRWVLVVGGIFLLVVYGASAKNRIWSYHGMMHGGIAQQIISGEVPPTNPYLAEQPLYFPWGYELLAAGVSRVLGVTTAWAFALVNIAALLSIMALVAGIGRQLVKDERACLWAGYVAVFGTTIFDGQVMAWLSARVGMGLEHRGVPFCMKLSNVNGAPLGLAFFCLLLYALLKIFMGGGRRYGDYVWLGLGLLAVGFFYPQMLFGTAAGVSAVCLVSLIRDGRLALRRVILTMVIGGVCALLLGPYLGGMSPGVRAAVGISTGWPLMAKIISYGLLSLALLVVIFANRDYLRRSVDGKGLGLLATVAAATLATYVVLSLPSRNEYKALMLSVFVLGIVGGVALAEMHKKWGRVGVGIVALLLMGPSYSYTVSKLMKMRDMPEVWREEGRDFHVNDGQEDELYGWIRGRTAKDSVFVDTELTIPLVAGRRLWVGPNKDNWQATAGFGVDFLADICRYETKLLVERQGVMAEIYEGKHTGGLDAVREKVGPGREVYVVARSQEVAERLEGVGYDRAFVSTSGKFSVYVAGTF